MNSLNHFEVPSVSIFSLHLFYTNDTEYAELLSKKKEIYAAYRKAREESRELLTVKANVDRVLGIEKDDAHEKEAPSETRS